MEQKRRIQKQSRVYGYLAYDRCGNINQCEEGGWFKRYWGYGSALHKKNKIIFQPHHIKTNLRWFKKL